MSKDHLEIFAAILLGLSLVAEPDPVRPVD